MAAMSARLAVKARRTARTVATSVVIMVAAGLLVIAAAICLGAAAWYALLPEVGALGAWLLVGVALGILAICLLLTRILWLRRARAELPPAPGLPFGSGLSRGPDLALIAGALLAGFLAGRDRRR